jgi:hypothetical protein
MESHIQSVTDYEPLNIGLVCNAGLALIWGDSGGSPAGQTFHRLALRYEDPVGPVGPLTMRGLPFWIGGPEPAPEQCLLALGSGLGEAPVTLQVGRHASRVIFAHRLLDTAMRMGASPGQTVAQYVFHLAGRPPLAVPIRERFEISVLPFADYPPFLAVADQEDGLYPRYAGPWAEAGRRPTEAWSGRARHFVLWAWENPDRERALDAIEIAPGGPRFVVGAITLGHADEEPFCRDALQPVIVRLAQAQDASQDFDLSIVVDRGVSTYAQPLPEHPASDFVTHGWTGWGERPNRAYRSAYAQVAANPSATLQVLARGERLGEVSWGELKARGRLSPSPALQVEIVSCGQNWVRTSVTDEDTGQRLPCRIHFRSPEGIPYAPHGHHAYPNSGLDTFNFDIGGDVRMGQLTYAYIDGTCQGWLPCGPVIVDVARGYEYQPLRTLLDIRPGQRELALRLKRRRDMNHERWFSGDSHVHFLSTVGAHLEARGEGLNVISLLTSQWGSLFSSTEEFTGQASVAPDGETIVYASQENRQHLLGHLNLLGLQQLVMPWCSDGLNEAELGGTLETTLAHWADACHAQGGTVVLPHFPVPNGEPPALIATGRVDAIEMTRDEPYRRLEYYRYLNAGYRLPLAGGTDKMDATVPVGLIRTYVFIPPGEPFSYHTWCRNLAAGRSFVTTGPLLSLAVEGCSIGDTVLLRPGGGTVAVEAHADGIFPTHRLELIQAGQVVAAVESPPGQSGSALSLKTHLKIHQHTWLAARCLGLPGTDSYDAWGRGLMAHTSPVYIACGGDWSMFDAEASSYMVTMIEGSLAYLRSRPRYHPPGAATHHHGQSDHLAFLERPFLEAREAIERRRARHAGG